MFGKRPYFTYEEADEMTALAFRDLDQARRDLFEYEKENPQDTDWIISLEHTYREKERSFLEAHEFANDLRTREADESLFEDARSVMRSVNLVDLAAAVVVVSVVLITIKIFFF